MAEIVNLRNQRRRRDRQAAAQQAADNRARFGRTEAEKLRDAADSARSRAVLDGARLDPGPAEPDPPTEA